VAVAEALDLGEADETVFRENVDSFPQPILEKVLPKIRVHSLDDAESESRDDASFLEDVR